jgi:ABC-type multidrug transport system fused ATPase/permease subunit
LGLLSTSDRKKLSLLTLLQVSLNLLDLAGIAAIGMLGALTISGVSGAAPGDRVSKVLDLLRLSELNIQQQATVLGFGAGVLLITKTVLSAYLTRTSLRFLGLKSVEISKSLVQRLLNSDLSIIHARSKQQNLFAITTGSSAITLGVVGAVVSLFADISLTVLIFTGLFVVDWSLSLSTIFLFGIVVIVVHRFLSNSARSLGSRMANLTVQSNQEVIDSLENFREIATRGQRHNFAARIGETRTSLAKTSSDLTFLPNISKYIVELTVVFGGLFVGSIQFVRQDAMHAVATLTVFVAASTRIAPAILRIQQSAVSLRVNLTACEAALELDVALQEIEINQTIRQNSWEKGSEMTINLKDLYFSYPSFAIQDVTLEIEPKTFIAIVGPSGSGKTTFVDLLLGVLKPLSGTIQFDGENAAEFIRHNPGAVGYVPQEVRIIRGSVRENILFGFSHKEYSDDHIWEALEIACLKETIMGFSDKLDTPIGDGHRSLSGGQRQRLGIARAVLTSPGLIVFDEATSALDAETESEINRSLSKLKVTATVVMIAHRLSTIQAASKVLYLEHGKILAEGSFEEVRKLIPNFDKQANILGL